jgi:amidase
VRIPAAWCHLVGLKPQRGRISGWPDAELFHGLTCHGPLARSVDDAARLLDVLAGSMPGDRHRPPAPEPPYA